MKLILVLGDQLAPKIAALRAADKARDIVVMSEVAAEATYVQHHPKKIALIFSAMRKFAQQLEADGWRVAYSQLDDAANSGSIPGELERHLAETGATGVLATRPGEWRLIQALEAADFPVELLEDDRFVASHREFETWAQSRKQLRMEYFYREMRRKTGLLMDGDQPAGGKWNFDQDNRKPASTDFVHKAPMWFEPDATVASVLKLVEDRFSTNFGEVAAFGYATDRAQAEAVMDHFVAHALPEFGDFQDAMLSRDRYLNHALISAYLNIGLLDPLDVCQRVDAAWREGRVPINAAEGFIRQVIGWREYVRGIYFFEGPDYAGRNALDHQRNLPDLFWGGETRMQCLSKVIEQTREDAYAHHIQRLMVTGNFALLAGLHPTEVHEWYLAVYIDAFEWVEAPNTIGMSQHADGGVVGSKPYVSSGNYIDRMSDYCGSCSYSVKAKSGETACPFNLLYWHFLMRHRTRFERNPRMAQMYRTWDRMSDDKRGTVLAEAEAFLDRMDAGAVI